MHRLAYNGDVARRSPGQLAVFQGGPSRTRGNEAPISGFIRVERVRDVGEASSLCSLEKKQSEDASPTTDEKGMIARKQQQSDWENSRTQALKNSRSQRRNEGLQPISHRTILEFLSARVLEFSRGNSGE